MEINRSNIVEIVNTFYTKPDKDYGQNFLIEPKVCEKIVDSLNVLGKERVLEVGPGIGSLTHYFNLMGADYTGVDIDQRMIDFLIYSYPAENMKFAECDIRKFDISKYEKVIANLPYNITTEAISYLLCNYKSCKKMVLMCQSETVAHFIDILGKEYGPISILIHLLGDIKTLFTVKAGSFYPAPKCNSTVFEINLNPNADQDKSIKVYQLSKKLFLNRRKTIYNNLCNTIADKNLALQVLEKCGINTNLRPEQIEPKMFQKIYEILNELKKQ